MRIKKGIPFKEPTFQDLIEICKEADQILWELRRFPKLQGKKPSNLKVALVHYLAEKKSINITIHHLFLIYGKMNSSITEHKKVIKPFLENRSIGNLK